MANACAGNEFQAVVEFAPYQKVPSEKKKVDVRAGTIEKGAYAVLHGGVDADSSQMRIISRSWNLSMLLLHLSP